MSNDTANLSEPTNSPQDALRTFTDFQLKPEILTSIQKMGFAEPTPVQSQCFECAMSGVDAVIMAQTGTGKTAAFGLPVVQRLNMDSKVVQALILVPTRELALQVSKEISAIGDELGAKCIPVYGGTSFSNQVREYEAGAQIVVGTPGRILDHIKRKTISFAGLKTVVLDEADEMLSMGFEKELQEIMEALPVARQTLLFSATIPDDIRRLAGKYMNEFVVISVSGDAVGATEISHFVYLVSGMGRVTDLVRVIDEERPGSAIIFCNTKEETQFVCNSLCDNGYHSKAISSDLSQAEREKVLGAIRENKIQFLVATDVAARGIDISHLSHVINFSFPDSLERYIHRTGRTGRQGKHGAAISLITPHDIGNLYMLRLTYKIFPVEKKLPEVANKGLQDELAMLDYFRSSVAGTEVKEQYYRLATRLLHATDAQFLMGNLLQQLFDDGEIKTPAPHKKQPTVPANQVKKPQPASQNIRESRPAKPEAAQEAVAAKTAVPEQKSRSNEKSKEQLAPKTPSISPKQNDRNDVKKKKDEPKSAIRGGDIASLEKSEEQLINSRTSIVPDFTDANASTDIYMDAGRKDGLKISSLMKEIVEKTRLQRTDIGKVRMLTRSTFINVPNVHCQAVFEMLSKIEVDGRKVTVEYAQES
ncbi:MAG: DEAD/DEAH box helicase [Deltaproteobacteria bacterium]|nr:DEAD/DEAH box helicase [Deltaproteobacteria bacterium]MBN2671485.1 DEAD/DEAH box helicase [Deltaproteobacteria bacterium]